MRARGQNEIGAMGAGDLMYPFENPGDPRDWLKMCDWAVSDTDPIVVLSELGRAVPHSARAELARHMLITASRM